MGVQSPFKVLDLNFVDLTGKKLLNHPLEPQNYSAIPDSYRDVEKIARGKALWRNKELIESPQGRTLKARCMSCHFNDGSDLKFFGFSLETIASRARFHGMSDAETDDLQAYIASLPIERRANPWDPPFQPGPGLSARSGLDWVAGAGIDAVQESASTTAAHVVGEHATADDFDAFSELQTLDVPVPIELPDWNSWLPLVHPDDYYDGAPYKTFVAPVVAALESRMRLHPDQHWYWETDARRVFLANVSHIEVPLHKLKDKTLSAFERRMRLDMNKLPLVKVLGSAMANPVTLERKVFPGQGVAQHMFMEVAPFETSGTMPLAVRNFGIDSPETLDLQWWNLAMQGIRNNSWEHQVFGFRWSYFATTFGALIEQELDNTGELVLYAKKMLELGKVRGFLEINKESYQKLFGHLQRRYWNANPEIANALLNAIVDTYYRLGGRTSMLRASLVYPSQTLATSTNYQDAIRLWADLLKGANATTGVNHDTLLRLASMCEEVWPNEDWARFVTR